MAEGARRSRATTRADLLELLLRATGDVVWDWEAASGEVVWSESSRRVLGHAPSAMPRSMAAWRGFVHPDDQARVAHGFEEWLADTRPTRSTDYRFLHADGHYVWVRDCGAAVRDAAGAPIRLVGALMDLTELRRVEGDLRLSLRILESVGDAVIATDPDGRVLHWNGAAERLYGWSASEAMGRDVAELVGARHVEPDATMERLRAGKAWSGEFAARRKDGSRVQVEVTDSPVLARGGELLAIVGVSRDLTRRHRDEQRLRESEERYRSLFDNNTDAVFAVDAEGRFADLNPASSALSGYSSEALVGRPFSILIHPDDLEKVSEAYFAVLGGETRRITARIRRKDGAARVLSIRGIPTLAAGEVVGLYGIAKDITDDLREEEARREQRERLASAVRARTRDLTLANQELESFAYSVSHDLRAPLRGLDHYAQVLEEDHASTLDEEGRDLVHRIRDQARHMGEIVQALLALSRVTREPLHRRRVDLTEIAWEVIDELRLAEPSRRVEAQVEEGLAVDADPQMMRVLVENLVGNAWKYTATRPVARIEVASWEAHDGERGFRVDDNGVGFDPAQRHRLFQPFQRLHAPSQFEGTGVGLATVARIVGRHGGRVWAESQPCKGSTFCFALPEKPTGELAGATVDAAPGRGA